MQESNEAPQVNTKENDEEGEWTLIDTTLKHSGDRVDYHRGMRRSLDGDIKFYKTKFREVKTEDAKDANGNPDPLRIAIYGRGKLG